MLHEEQNNRLPGEEKVETFFPGIPRGSNRNNCHVLRRSFPAKDTTAFPRFGLGVEIGIWRAFITCRRYVRSSGQYGMNPFTSQ
ncbi:uncharacterized protein CLUP02_17537 [Colletotrichum lupini]|uniref:Uncharacterized protein n=1 Tax=Colletotrichum lupini TaxID=145971 RepID=A0A9Q8WAG6_9PEZI|nr:uncharacterized protein CLUP02_17537 [Colletotrichum lupini]UQC76026.1 hypothetical protein CLUP02_17537 [Colletotrichum lupini]